MKPEPCVFFTIIGPFDLIDKKVRVPSIASTAYGVELSDGAKLVVPTGQEWLVCTEREDRSGALYFTDGWENFAEFYSIQIGFLLTFTYNGRTNFNVRVYNLRCSEIIYPEPPPRRAPRLFGKKKKNDTPTSPPVDVKSEEEKELSTTDSEDDDDDAYVPYSSSGEDSDDDEYVPYS